MGGFIKCLRCSEELEMIYSFCPRCGSDVNKEEVLIRYFHRGFSRLSILSFLKKYHEIEMSMRTLRNRLRDYGLKRRGINTNDREIYQAVRDELDGPGCMRGYRAMWHCLRLDYGIQTPRSKVENVVSELDPRVQLYVRLIDLEEDRTAVLTLSLRGTWMAMTN